MSVTHGLLCPLWGQEHRGPFAHPHGLPGKKNILYLGLYIASLKKFRDPDSVAMGIPKGHLK